MSFRPYLMVAVVELFQTLMSFILSLLDHLQKLDIHVAKNPQYTVFSNVVRYLDSTGMIPGNFYIGSPDTSPFNTILTNLVSILQGLSALYSWHTMQQPLKSHTCKLEIQEIQHALNVLYVYMFACILVLTSAAIINCAYVPDGLYADLGVSSVLIMLYLVTLLVAGIALSAYFSACLLLVIGDVRMCSVLIEALAEHIANNTITWDVYLLVRRQIKTRVELAFWSNNVMAFFAYISVSPLPPDLFMRIYFHHTHDPITLSLLGVRAKKFNVFFQLTTITLVPTVVFGLKRIFPQLNAYF
eukprot:gene26531-32063_t